MICINNLWALQQLIKQIVRFLMLQTNEILSEWCLENFDRIIATWRLIVECRHPKRQRSLLWLFLHVPKSVVITVEYPRFSFVVCTLLFRFYRCLNSISVCEEITCIVSLQFLLGYRAASALLLHIKTSEKSLQQQGHSLEAQACWPRVAFELQIALLLKAMIA